MMPAERRAGASLPPGRNGRLPFLDVARALAVLTMLAGNLVNIFLTERPRWLAHNLGDELLPLDLPAPVLQPVYHLLGHVPALPEAVGLTLVVMVVLGVSALTLTLARRGFRIPL